MHPFTIERSTPPYAPVVCGVGVLCWQIIPDHAQYRKDVEAISGYRLKVAMETEDVRGGRGTGTRKGWGSGFHGRGPRGVRCSLLSGYRVSFVFVIAVVSFFWRASVGI